MAEYSGPTWAPGDKLTAAQANSIARAIEDHASRVAGFETSLSDGSLKGEPGDPGQPGDPGGPGQPGANGKDGSVVTATTKSVALNKDQPVGIIFGSSTVYGSGTSEATRAQDRFARQLERKIQRWHSVPANRAPLSMIAGDSNSPHVSGGSITSNAGLGKFSRLVPADGTVTFTSPYPSTGIMVGFREGASVGTLKCSIDGGEPVDVPVGKTGTSLWTGKWSSPVVARGNHSYAFTATGGANLFDFVHFYDDTNTKGPILLNGGWGEETFAGLLSKPSTAARLKSVNPDFIIVVTGSNEQGADQSKADFQASIDSFRTMLASNTTGPKWIVFVSIARPGTSSYDRINVTGPMKDAATASPATTSYIGSLETFWTGNSNDQQVIGTLSSDAVHPSASGHAAIADIVASAIGVNVASGSVNAAILS